MRVLIYGAGSVGGFLGGHLALGGHDVTLLGRQPLVDAVEAGGFTLQLQSGTRQIPHIRAAASLDDALGGDKPFDWIAFTMKSYDTVQAIFDLQARLSEPPHLISFQNGIGNEESLRAGFGPEIVSAGTVTTPLSIPRPGVVVESKQRGIALAADSPGFALIHEAFSTTGLTVQIVEETRSLKWSKLLLNILGNAISAILDLPPGEVFRQPALFALERAAFLEAVAIMELHKIDAVDLPGAPVRQLKNFLKTVPPIVARPILRRQMASGRGGKMPSLQAALHAGQRKTEVAWLNGAVVQAADDMKRLAPVNHALALTLSDIASGRAPWEMYRHKPDMLLTAVRIASK